MEGSLKQEPCPGQRRTDPAAPEAGTGCSAARSGTVAGPHGGPLAGAGVRGGVARSRSRHSSRKTALAGVGAAQGVAMTGAQTGCPGCVWKMGSRSGPEMAATGSTWHLFTLPPPPFAWNVFLLLTRAPTHITPTYSHSAHTALTYPHYPLTHHTPFTRNARCHSDHTPHRYAHNTHTHILSLTHTTLTSYTHYTLSSHCLPEKHFLLLAGVTL